MTHYIICKFKEKITAEQLADIREIFARTTEIEGIRSVSVKRNVVDRSNRADLMIAIVMDGNALPVYDGSEAHKLWKERYGALIAEKTIFDGED